MAKEKKRCKKDKTSKFIVQNTKEFPRLQTQNVNQGKYADAIEDFNQIISLGPAGTGKSYIASWYAAYEFTRNNIDRIILTRPLASIGTSNGLLPGTIDEKMEPWLKPITFVLMDLMGREVYDIARRHGIRDEGRSIVFQPVEMLQGQTFNDCFVILDEAQNMTAFEMKIFLSRMGKGTTVIVNGDIRQKAIKEDSGLGHVIKLVDKFGLPVPVIEFSSDDIVRSDMTRVWIKAFDADEDGYIYDPTNDLKNI